MGSFEFVLILICETISMLCHESISLGFRSDLSTFPRCSSVLWSQRTQVFFLLDVFCLKRGGGNFFYAVVQI